MGKKSERLVVRKQSKALYEFPLFRISEILVASPGISVSTDLISEACKRGIRMSFLTSNGTPIALLASPLLTAVVDQRREQMLAYNDGRAVVFAREVARGKIINQRRLLQYFGKYLKKKERQQARGTFSEATRPDGVKARPNSGSTRLPKRSPGWKTTHDRCFSR